MPNCEVWTNVLATQHVLLIASEHEGELYDLRHCYNLKNLTQTSLKQRGNVLVIN